MSPLTKLQIDEETKRKNGEGNEKESNNFVSTKSDYIYEATFDTLRTDY